MPSYTLRCTECGKEYKVMISFSKLEKTSCPKCGSTNKERVYTGSCITVGKGSKGG